MALKNIQYLVIHTSASRKRGVDAAEIDRWHRSRGWRGIGYHFVIVDGTHSHLMDGAVQTGRSETEIGAHTLGINSISLGICCVGHGDDQDFSRPQKEALVELLASLVVKYRVPVANIIGHRDINSLIARGLVSDQYTTDKTCPGNKVSLSEIRSLVKAQLGRRDRPQASKTINRDPIAVPDQRRRLKAGVRLVERYISAAPNASDHWLNFRNHPEMRDLLDD